ncbi:hypothetical protein [Beggiatoa leptomitoformis]|uniref:DUF8196 domain-containing protein n=1 Tax=Beggiatoa leptomitoformis TaxID=288004 RepID=A0A2N9YD00_9GAMM|nr:hypothetical protein [Beggiatoa leptomitoformis]ALG69210.1 hypothetical protein AL038_17870 [Beggiatoa leptomitoformis]AUI68358.1 hypothetical protein BLE401_06355 [Beggiatoa leptomitoformis]
MSDAQEIWELFRETSRQLQELRYQTQETDRKFQETDRKFLETDRKFLETARRFQETDRKFLETDLKFQETDRKFQETAHRFQETEKLLNTYAQAAEKRSRELDKKIGSLSNRLGEFVEGLIKPNVVPLLQARGIDVHVVSRDVEADNPQLGLAMQIDLLATNGDCCVLVEVKSHLSQDDIDEHIARLEKFKPLFPKYQDSKVFGAVAGMVIPDNVAKYAYRKGFFVITQKHDTAVMLNDTQFQPKAW